MDPQKTTVKKISSGVWAFEQEIVRCFLIVGQARAMLLDTGAEPCDLLKSIRSITQLPLVVLHTHGDGDHTANDDLFPDIHAHPAEFETIRRFRPNLRSNLHPITGLSSFDLGERVLQVIETPGHTPGHICLYNKDEKLLITGDTLFRESIGRTDLPGGDYSWIMRSILDKLMPLGGDVHFYPGHGQDSTIGHEALYNPFVTEVLGGEVNY